MSINKDSASKLFNIPSVQREDPFVTRVEVSDKPSDTKIEVSAQYTSYVEQMNYLAYGFDSMVIEYDMLIDVLVKRAKMRNVKLNTSSLAKSDLAFANHLSVLYGTQIKELDFAAYVELLKYEQILASSHTSQLVNVVDPKIPESKDTESIIAKPESAGITAIKKEYIKYLTDNNFNDLLLVDILIYNSHNAASNKAVIQKITERTDGGNALNETLADQAKSDKKNQLLQDCFPCLERTLNLNGDWPYNSLWDYFVAEFWKGFLSQLQQLAKMKLAITNIGFGSAICTIIDMLTKSLCLPDLGALLAFINMMIARVKNTLVGKFNVSAGAAINDLVSLIVTPVLDAILALLVRAMNSVFSPIDCIVTSLNHEMDKIFPPELYPVLGFQSSDIRLDSPRQAVQQLLTDIYTEKRDLETKVLTFINEKTKNWELKLHEEDEALDLYVNLDKYMAFASMIYEIIDLVKTFNVAVADVAFGNKTKEEAFQTICQHSINKDKPWLGFRDDDKYYDDLGYGDDNDGGGSGNGGGDGIKTIRDRFKIIDSSLPPEFFDGDDIITVLDDDKIKEIIDGLKYDDDIQNGKDPLSLDENFINNYRQIKNQFKSNILLPADTGDSTLNNDSPQQPLFVVGTVDFAECLALNNLQGKTKEQVQNWINKITG